MPVIARDITLLEDDIRRDGSISIKSPDIWGDGDLIAAIQEYETNMSLGNSAEFKDRFSESLQGLISRSDFAEFQSATAIGQALGGATIGNLPGNPVTGADGKATQVNVITATLPESAGLAKKFDSDSISSGAVKAIASNVKGPIGIEPTELDRQRSTFILANQALRRRMIGDDNTRAAGYGLYLFRIPVSVLPGRETSEGYSAVATLRAQLQVDANHLKNTLPKMVIADAIESLMPRILADWDDAIARKHEKQSESAPQNNVLPRAEFAPSASPKPIASAVPYTAQDAVYGREQIEQIEDLAIDQLESQPKEFTLDRPKAEEIRRFLYGLFEQTHAVLEENNVYANSVQLIDLTADEFVKGRYASLPNLRNDWCASVGTCNIDPRYRNASWILAMHMGITDRNLKKLLKDLAARGEVAMEQCGNIEVAHFYVAYDPVAVPLWETIIREAFPLHVFNLDPVAEEQNAFDAFSRRREMQVALAFSVAKGNVFTADQKLKMSRQLALDEAAIALNRTAIAFAHGDDTFGWYFHPRIQTPPTESSNLGALARTIWSTGPTDHYDRRHRRLEPGIRECEVLVAMPSFVSEVSFDVTTNWEKIACPGVTKRSYEEMLAQGSRLHRLRMCMKEPMNQQCYRPGDMQRMVSRIDQLESMLGMQTYNVNLPFRNDQTGTSLLDSGRKQLLPSVDFYYGLSYIDAGDDKGAQFFITGRNFHPTLTHVVVGGVEVHSNQEDKVEVINRELIRVTIGKLNTKLSAGNHFEVRVATPAGMSNVLVINKTPDAPVQSTPTYAWKNVTKLSGYFDCTTPPRTISIGNLPPRFGIAADPAAGLQEDGVISFQVDFTSPAGDKVATGVIEKIPFKKWVMERTDFFNGLNSFVSTLQPNQAIEGTITCQGYVIGTVPVTIDPPIVIQVTKPVCVADCKEDAGASRPSATA
ncbi:MAG: hypothetical protein U0892_16170 [Pirellulales bacterium]